MAWVVLWAAIALTVNGISQAVMLATPADLDDFALGFALNEGWLASKRDLLEYREKYAPRNRSRQITGPWVKNFVEMAKKTIIRRSFKYLPVNIEAKKAASVDETTPDYSDVFQPVITDSTDDVTAEVMDTDTEADSEAKDGE